MANFASLNTVKHHNYIRIERQKQYEEERLRMFAEALDREAVRLFFSFGLYCIFCFF